MAESAVNLQTGYLLKVEIAVQPVPLDIAERNLFEWPPQSRTGKGFGEDQCRPS
jgi:hypothetical protein